MQERRFVVPASDFSHEWRIAKMAANGLKQAANEGKAEAVAVEIVIRKYEPKRTDPQRSTFWMWHGEVSAELSIRTKTRWSKEDVHEVIFLEKFMPRKEVIDIETGEIKSRPLRTSEANKAQISEAMTAYLAWAYDHGIEVTVPEGGW